jgi:hypothetical protein
MIRDKQFICDRCAASIGDDYVTLGIDAPGVKGEDHTYYAGWIAHYHPRCYDQVSHDVWEAADRLPGYEAGSVEALNAIPIADEHAIELMRMSHLAADGSRVGEQMMRRHSARRDAADKWRRMSQDERDAVIIDALGDDKLAVWPLLTRLWDRHDDLHFGDAKLRAQVKSMVDRGLLGRDTEKPPKGRSRTCWFVRDLARVGQGRVAGAGDGEGPDAA